MRPHPCAGHPCDHCFTCDVLGVCCASLSSGQRARLEADDQAQPDRLRAAIAQDAGTVPNLPELVRQDAAQPWALSAAARLRLLDVLPADHFHDSRKEAQHAIPARPK